MDKFGKLGEADGKVLLQTARAAIRMRLSGAESDRRETSEIPPCLLEPGGTFVTLTKNGALRGCIGHIVSDEPLIEGVRKNAVNSAFEDPRFPPLRREELDMIRIEVSVLTAPAPLEYLDRRDLLEKLQPGIDGVIIRKGAHQATFLPQVWEQLPDKERFLTHLCLKAGLSADAWRGGDLAVSIYRVQAFEEH
jgi:AmmeMemoRadiSam system protein A